MEDFSKNMLLNAPLLALGQSQEKYRSQNQLGSCASSAGS